MATGTVATPKPQAAVVEKLRGFLAAANCEIVESAHDHLAFRHGTYLTQTAPLFRKSCRLDFTESAGTTTVRYSVRPAPFIRVWLTLVAIVFCWTVFVPLLAYRALAYHPRRFVENLLAGV